MGESENEITCYDIFIVGRHYRNYILQLSVTVVNTCIKEHSCSKINKVVGRELQTWHKRKVRRSAYPHILLPINSIKTQTAIYNGSICWVIAKTIK